MLDRRGDDRHPRFVLVECPACGDDLEGRHIKTSHHIAGHAPEDFGLAPLGAGRSDGRSPVAASSHTLELARTDGGGQR